LLQSIARVSETPVVTETCGSRRLIIIGFVFVLVLASAYSQIPSPSQTAIQWINPRAFVPTRPTPRDRVGPIFSRPPSNVSTATPASATPFQARLEVSPSTKVEVGQRIWFKVFPQLPSDLGVQYNFDFGDRSANVQTNDPQTPYAYNSSGWYRGSVEIRTRGGRLSLPKIFGPVVQVFSPSSPSPSSTATSVPITPTPPSRYSPSPTVIATVGSSSTATRPPSTPNVASPTATWSPYRRNTATPTTTRTPFVSRGRSWRDKISWIHYIVSTGLAAAALYGILMLIKPTFRLHWNRDEPQMPLENVTINYELHFDSNISAGRDRLDVPGASLILRKRTQ